MKKNKLRNILFVLPLLSLCFLTSCISLNNSGKKKSEVYANLYEEKPLTVIIMSPVNKSGNKEAGMYFYSTLHEPLAEAGYYVLPPFITRNILKGQKSFEGNAITVGDLKQFSEKYGADAALFTTINKWDKSVLISQISVSIDYMLISTKTGKLLFKRTSNYVEKGRSSSNHFFLDSLINSIDTALTKNIDAARYCNLYAFYDLPSGKYKSTCGTDGEDEALKTEISVSR